MNGHHSKAMSILKKISASNNIELSEKALQQQEEVVSCLPKEEVSNLLFRLIDVPTYI